MASGCKIVLGYDGTLLFVFYTANNIFVKILSAVDSVSSRLLMYLV